MSKKKTHVAIYVQVNTKPVIEGREALVRAIGVIRHATLSRAARYVILRNDAHPHRVGKAGTITRADLDRKYVLT